MFFGYFDSENIFLDNKINNFRGELTDDSAKKEALSVCCTLGISVAVLAETSLKSPRKLFIVIIKKCFYWIKVSEK